MEKHNRKKTFKQKFRKFLALFIVMFILSMFLVPLACSAQTTSDNPLTSLFTISKLINSLSRWGC